MDHWKTGPILPQMCQNDATSLRGSPILNHFILVNPSINKRIPDDSEQDSIITVFWTLGMDSSPFHAGSCSLFHFGGLALPVASNRLEIRMKIFHARRERASTPQCRQEKLPIRNTKVE